MVGQTESGPLLDGSGNRRVYRAAVRGHVHALIAMGYERLEPADFVNSEEPDITGALVDAMHDAIQDRDAPDWVDHYALPKDDRPLSVAGRRGKRRFRVDIEFERVRHGPRPLFRFEAKRLGARHPVCDYLGEDGMGCFLTGRYPVTDDEAGMLGYVQSDDEQAWAERIERRLHTNNSAYSIRSDGAWCRVRVVSGLSHTYRTRHDRKSPLPPVTIRHVLLRFR